jgi:hypothetical protein
MSASIVVKRGMRIVFKPEWRDKGDDKYTFVAVTDAHPLDGGFDVSTIENTMFIRPRSSARMHMVESAEPLLPVTTIVFLNLDKKGARCQMRRMLGDRELSVTVEVIARSTFRRLFRRGAADCKEGQELRSGVEFPDNTTTGTALL